MSTPDPYRQSLAFDANNSPQSKKGYPWLFFYTSRPWKIGVIVSALFIALGSIVYFWYSQSGNDTAPDSTLGLIYATAGTFFLLFALVLYTVRRRSRKKAIGQLNAALNWHMFFAITGLAMLFMHSFGNFSAISGTYALYGMIALTISGFVGRMLDRLLPRMIARQVHTVLTAQGDDRIETISQKLQTIVLHNNQKMHGFALPSTDRSSVPSELPTPTKVSMAPRGMTLHAPWDLAYISLEPTQQELDRDAPHHRFVPDKKSVLDRPETFMPGVEEQLAELQSVNAALRREQRYRYIIRQWRILHIALAFITIGLVIWHLIFAATILFPGLF
ncbi:MAG: hypothetical protein ACR2H5_17745 [Ktedonobacteraceae bacterium]